MEPIHILIISDSAFVLSGVTKIMGEVATCDIVGAFLTVDHQWRLFYQPPDVILICAMSMPSTNVCLLIEESKRRYPRCAVLLMGRMQPAQVIAAYINAGASGILNQDLAPEQFIQAVHDVRRYGLLLDSQVLPKLQQALQHEQIHAPLAALTERELDVVLHAVQGRTNQKIADELNLSINTVKTHLRNAFEKLNVSSRSELAVLVVSSGMTLSEGRVAYVV